MSFIIAGATIGAAVIGGGAAIYGANKSSKAAKQAANRTAKAADDANRVETMYKMMGQGAQGINPFSTEGDLQAFFDTGGAGGKAVGPSTGAMPLYADKFTGVENFEGKEFRVLKEVLAEVLIQKIFPIGHEVRKMLNEENYLTEVLEEGAQKAKEQAEANLKEVKNIIGFI